MSHVTCDVLTTHHSPDMSMRMFNVQCSMDLWKRNCIRMSNMWCIWTHTLYNCIGMSQLYANVSVVHAMCKLLYPTLFYPTYCTLYPVYASSRYIDTLQHTATPTVPCTLSMHPRDKSISIQMYRLYRLLDTTNVSTVTYIYTLACLFILACIL